MAKELVHLDAGAQLTQTEDNALDRHYMTGGVANDMLVYDATNAKLIGKTRAETMALLSGQAAAVFTFPKGIICTPMTQPGSASEGELIYNSGTDKLNLYTGSSWVVIPGTAAGGADFTGKMTQAWTTTEATAGEQGFAITTTDSVVQTAGIIQSLLVDHNITGAKSSTAQTEAISVDMSIGANVNYAYPIAVYVSQSGNPDISGFLAGAQIYLEDMGSGTLNAIAGLDIQIGSTNLASSRHTGIRLVSHTGTAKSGIMFEKAWTVGIDFSGTGSGGSAATFATADIRFQGGTTLLDDGTDLTLAGANLSIGANFLKTTNLIFKEGESTAFHIKNAADDNYQNLKLGTLFPTVVEGLIDGAVVQAGNTNNYYLILKARDTDSGEVEVARLQGAADPYFSIGGSQEFKFYYSGVATFGAVTLGGAITGGDQAFTAIGDMTFTAGSILKSGSTNTNTLLIAANDTTFITLTTGSTDTMILGKSFFYDAGGEYIESDGTDLNIASGNEILLTATADVVIPVNIGLHFGDGAEKIESNNTDLTINSGVDINLTATTDINVPANVGLTFGDDGEKIEGNATDLTIASSNLLNLSATTDVVIPVNVGLVFGDGAEKIESNNTDFTINSGGEICLTATSDVVLPVNIGLHFGDGAEKIESNNTDMTINSGADINLTATADINIPQDIGLTFGSDSFKIEADADSLNITGAVELGSTLAVTGTTTLATALTGVLRVDSGVVSVDSTAFADASGTPTDGQVAIWTDANTIEGSDIGTIMVAASDATAAEKAAALASGGTVCDGARSSITIEDCEDAWNELVDGDVTASLDGVDYKTGSGSAKFICDALLDAGDIIATEQISSTDLSDHKAVQFWFKTTVELRSGDIQLLLDDHANCASPAESLNLPRVRANKWYHISLKLANPGSDAAIISVGLKYIRDLGAVTINIDHIEQAHADEADVHAAQALAANGKVILSSGTHKWESPVFDSAKVTGQGNDGSTILELEGTIHIVLDEGPNTGGDISDALILTPDPYDGCAVELFADLVNFEDKGTLLNNIRICGQGTDLGGTGLRLSAYAIEGTTGAISLCHFGKTQIQGYDFVNDWAYEYGIEWYGNSLDASGSPYNYGYVNGNTFDAITIKHCKYMFDIYAHSVQDGLGQVIGNTVASLQMQSCASTEEGLTLSGQWFGAIESNMFPSVWAWDFPANKNCVNNAYESQRAYIVGRMDEPYVNAGLGSTLINYRLGERLVPPIRTGTWYGDVKIATAGENVAINNICYLKSDAKYWKTDADAEATSKGKLAIALETISADADGRFLQPDGWLFDSGFNLTPGGEVYLSVTTGGMSQTAPTGDGDIVRIIGYGDEDNADNFHFLPDDTYMELDGSGNIEKVNGDSLLVATTTAKGIASFNTSDFAVSSGAVSLQRVRNIILTAAGGWPSTTNGCSANTLVEYTTNDQDLYHLDFATGADEFAQWTTVLPDDYNAGTVTAIFHWTCTGGGAAETVKWYLQGFAYANDAPIDSAWGSAVGVADTWIADNDVHVTAATGAITIGGGPAAGELCQWRVYRDVSEDDLGVDARLLSVKIIYTGK